MLHIRDRIQDIDSSRRMAHDNAITNLNVLNRMCAMHDIEPFANIDTTDRYAVADFVGKFASEIYSNGTHANMDDLVKNHVSHEFSKKEIHTHITNIHNTCSPPTPIPENNERDDDYEPQ